MNDYISIDPGAEQCALAVWGLPDAIQRDAHAVSADKARLVRVVSYGSREYPTEQAPTVVVEVPQADGRATTSDDMYRVAVSAGRMGARATTVHLLEYQPRQWKGSLPKAICHLRMWQALSDTEKPLLGGDVTAKAIANACNRGAKARWKKHANHHYSNRDLPTVAGLKITHDILDAVALGLWYLGRLNLAAVTKG
jgi:hypothetical protein